jgi:hypothetical protein
MTLVNAATRRLREAACTPTYVLTNHILIILHTHRHNCLEAQQLSNRIGSPSSLRYEAFGYYLLPEAHFALTV